MSQAPPLYPDTQLQPLLGSLAGLIRQARQQVLPTEEELRAELDRERALLAGNPSLGLDQD